LTDPLGLCPRVLHCTLYTVYTVHYDNVLITHHWQQQHQSLPPLRCCCCCCCCWRRRRQLHAQQRRQRRQLHDAQAGARMRYGTIPQHSPVLTAQRQALFQPLRLLLRVVLGTSTPLHQAIQVLPTLMGMSCRHQCYVARSAAIDSHCRSWDWRTAPYWQTWSHCCQCHRHRHRHRHRQRQCQRHSRRYQQRDENDE
jgi:hypothetical protein